MTEVSDNSVTVFAKNFDLVYSSGGGKSRKYNIKVEIKNINRTVEVGDQVNAGDIIGYANASLECENSNEDYWNDYNGFNCYLHVSVKIDKLVNKFNHISPELLIY